MKVAAEQGRLPELQTRPPINLPSVFCLDRLVATAQIVDAT